MNPLAIVLLAAAALAPAPQQDPPSGHKPVTQAIVSIHWNLLEKRLCADVGIGHEDSSDGAFVIDKLDDQYCIDPAKGTMTYRGETVAFDKDTAVEEKKMLKDLLRVLSEYTSDSVEWFHQKGAETEKKPVAFRR